MKLTKVDKVRSAVSKEKYEQGRGILYTATNSSNEADPRLKINARIQQANRMYGVFFKFVRENDLEYHFTQIVKSASTVDNADTFVDNLFRYAEGKMAYFFYNNRNKDTQWMLKLHIQERMTDLWQEEDNNRVALKVLMCICAEGNARKRAMEGLRYQKDAVETFMAASKACGGNPYISGDTSQLEQLFTSAMKSMVKKCDVMVYQNGDDAAINEMLENQIKYLRNFTGLGIREYNPSTGKAEFVRKDLATYFFRDAQDYRMEAICVRMRQTLKRGQNGVIARLLLQGIAQMNGMSLKKVIDKLRWDEDGYRELKNFVNAVNKDYYKVNIAKSVMKQNVKVQVPEKADSDRILLNLSSAEDVKRSVLNRTLERYASSKEAADEVLLDLKTLVFDYFLPGVPREEFLQPDTIFIMPPETKTFFDEGFTSEEKEVKEDAAVSLSELWEAEYNNQGSIKNRIKYVNYGVYLKLRRDEQDEFRLYWLGVIKEYVEQNYTFRDKKKKSTRRRGKEHVESTLTKEQCYRVDMFKECWKYIVRFLCGKYIDIGKGVFHFAMPEDMQPENGAIYGELQPKYRDGISSFVYENIKADETLKRVIANATVAAAFNFTASVIDSRKQDTLGEDILFESKSKVLGALRSDAQKQILRFYGGISQVRGLEKVQTQDMVFELLDHIKSVRNQNFHYTAGVDKSLSFDVTKLLWRNDELAFCQLIKDRYYYNNVAMFYEVSEIRALVQQIYAENLSVEAQIPAFRSVIKRVDLAEYIADWKLPWRKNDSKHVIFEGALYFLLKEIYYSAFVVDTSAAQRLLTTITAYRAEVAEHVERLSRAYKDIRGELAKEKTPRLQAQMRHAKQEWQKRVKEQSAVENFAEYVETVKQQYAQDTITLGGICQAIVNEYNQQNNQKTDEEIYEHFKMLLPLCMKIAFHKYIEDKFNFVLHPNYFSDQPEYQESDGRADGYLEDIEMKSQMHEIGNEQFGDEKYVWYTFAHFVHPRQLNRLIGNLKNYLQYREDIFKRAEYAGQFKTAEERQEEFLAVEQQLNRAKNILQIFEFVRDISGRVSLEFSDYYEEDEESTAREKYAEYMSRYINFDNEEGDNTFEKFTNFCVKNKFVIYGDENSTRVLRNVELARMYAGGEVPLKGYARISKEEIKKYYGIKDELARLQTKGRCESMEEQDTISFGQYLKGRITLNEVTEIYSVISELLGQLVSLSYLRERDEMYLLLGFYYMALRSAESWQEELIGVEEGSYSVKDGLVLHQVVSIFDYGVQLLYPAESGKWKRMGGSVSGKIRKFSEIHGDSMACALRLFENDKYSTDISSLRNYVDHSKYYVKRDKSILELYNEYYKKFFGYSSKLRKSVLFNMENILYKYLINCKIKFTGSGKKTKFVFAGEFDSHKFKHKLKDDTVIESDAKSKTYLMQLKRVIEYKE